MKVKNIFYYTSLLALMTFFSCKKEEDLVNSNAQFAASKTNVVVNEEIQFTNQSKNATAFKWSFGDGTTSVEANPKKAFSSSSVFKVDLVATGEGGSTTSSIQITVLPSCFFIVENEDSLFAGIEVQFINNSKGATSYQWSFGDANNSTSSDTNSTFAYDNGGTYTVTLTALSAVGETSFSKEITLEGAPIVKQLYFIEYDNNLIKKLPLDGTGNTTDILDITGKAGVGLAYDQANSKIYFSDFEVTGTGNIWRVNEDGSGIEAIVSDLSDPYAIALDLGAGKIYWTDDLGNISRANLDGSTQEIGIVNVAGGQMRAIALDEENNKMYFYEVNNEDLYVANLDGTGAVVLFPGIYGYAIAIDKVNDKIYFDDQNSSSLVRASLDGSGGFTTIDSDGSRIYGMVIDNTDNKIYWSGRDSGTLTRANLDGSAAEVLLTGSSSPRGIFLKQ
jgi:PKD repeat protein